jgi:hypothetical protein
MFEFHKILGFSRLAKEIRKSAPWSKCASLWYVKIQYASQRTQSISFKKTNQVMLFREITAAY